MRRLTRPNLASSRLSRSVSRPRVPDGTRVYVVGDIHGRLDLLDEKLHKIAAYNSERPPAESTLVFVGDYVDRGVHSKGVIDRLVDVSSRVNMVSILGNHEQMLLDFLADPAVLLDWVALGGLATLLSYGLRPSLQPGDDECARLSQELRERISDEHLMFLGSLRPSHTIGDYFFVHAGIRPGIALDKQDKNDLIWIRGEFTQSRLDHTKVIVHGHTPVARPEIKKNRINIDTGAYATGLLTCLVLEGERRSLL